VTRQHQRVNVVTAAKLHEVYLQQKYKSCVWASAAVVRECNLAKRGEKPVSAPQCDGSEFELYNLDQLLHFSRTATGTCFPMALQRALSLEQFQRNHRSTVWFLEQQLGKGIVVRPGQTPSLLTFEGVAERLYNTDQLVRPERPHAFGNGQPVTGADAFVLEHVTERRGFTSNVWSAESIVGIRPRVACIANVFDTRFCTRGVYNHDQLEWPIPVPDPLHCFSNGAAFLPHDQVVLEQARVTLGLSSRRWFVAHSHVTGNNVLPGAELTKVSTAIPRGMIELVNADQLIEAAHSTR
jgi:hypothetical protein